MQSHPNALLYLPGEKERELWRCETGGEWRRVEERGAGAGGTYVIEAEALESVPFWAVEPADRQLDTEKVASLKWESLGMDDSGDGQSWTHWTAGRLEKRVLIASAGLASDAPNSDWLKVTPQAFEISPRLFAVPFGEAAIWRELGRCVVAFTHGDELVHFSVMSARKLNAEAATEIRDLVCALQVQGFLAKLGGLRVWTQTEPGFEEAIKKLLSVQAIAEPKPAPRLPSLASGIFPPEAARRRRDKARKRGQAQMVMALAALYVLCFTAWAGWLKWREHKLAKMTTLLEEVRPAVDTVRREQARWQVFDAATNPDQYPVELFQRIASLLPPEGIRLKQFDIEPNKIMLVGEASTVGHAKKFQSDVTSSPQLQQYTWNFPQPTILEDSRANFRAEGIIGTGGSHEGQ